MKNVEFNVPCLPLQFYHLASVRLQDLCNRLELYEEDLRKKIWTCFEYSVMNHTELMQDRHLDQILMCAVYVICKVITLGHSPALTNSEEWSCVMYSVVNLFF